MVYSEEIEEKYRGIQSKLFEAKTQKGLKLKDLAKRGITKAQWARVTGDPERHPSVKIVMMIADCLGYDLVLVPKGVAK